ncbi:MAG: flagellar hook-basal body complex protein [Kiloniellales bacterium]
MSIFGAMFAGVTGLNANSQALGMIADNIANVNTIGFKATKAQFFTLVTQAASRTTYTPGGVSSSPAQGIDRQGLLQSSASKTDIAIAGRGFFVVNEAATPTSGNEFLFTRAGSFNPDENGNLVNTAGYYLQGWPLSNGTTLPTNTSTLSSVTTINVANLAGTATPSSNVTLALNLPSTAPSAAGGGQINTSISSPLNGVTDIDSMSFGTLNDVARVDYVASTSTMTITIAGQTGSFDLSNRTAGIYTSTGTLAGMEITLASSFDFTSDISSGTLTNTATETSGVGAEPSTFSLATDLAGIATLSFNSAVSNNDVISFSYDKSSGVFTVSDETTSQSGTITIGTSGGNGTQDYTIATGALAGTIVTIDTNTFDYNTSFSDAGNLTTSAISGTGDLTLAANAVSTAFTNTAPRNFTVSQIQFDVDDADGVTISNVTAGYTVAVTSGADDFAQAANDVTVRVTHTASGATFDVVLDVTNAITATGNDSTVTLNLNELKSHIAGDSDNLVVAATAPTLSNFGAADLATLSTTVFNFNVDANGRLQMTGGPTGYSVDQTATQALNVTGTRSVVVTNGTNSFTITLDITTAISTGSADIAVDLQQTLNSFGLGTAPGGGKFSATVQIFDSLGNAHDVVLDFDKVGTNSWQILVNDPLLASSGVTSGTVAPATRSINFNGDGTPSAINFPPIVISGWTTGANTSTVAVNLGTIGQAGGVTQFAGEFALSSIDQDGVRFGGFVGVNISSDGTVTAVFDNGEQLPIYKLALTLFANPNGLESVTGNAFRQTDRSGDILLQQANTGGSGSVASSALESSTVDLAEEFIKMITTQRAYSANARIITTADEMLEELIRLRR